MPNDVYAVGGYSAVAPAALSEPNPPPSRFKGKLGQMYFDTSVTPPDLSIYNGSSWVSTAFNEGFPVTPYVVGPSGQAGYQTIQSALDAANADGGGMIWVQPGTYTENLTFYSDIQISGPSEQSVTIVGIHTPPTSGTLNIDRLTFQSATHIFSSNAAGTTAIIMEDCSVNVTNGYTFNLPNWQSPGSIAAFNIGPFGTNDGFINNIGAATVAIFAAGVGNGSANPMIISGPTFFGPGMTINCPVDCASGANIVSTNNQYFGTFTFNGNSTAAFYNDSFVTGAAPAITMSSSGTVSLSNVVIKSTNNPAITGAGAGTLTYSGLSFIGNTSFAGTLTLSGTTLTPDINTSLSSGTLSVKSTTANPGDNAGFIRTIVNGTTAYIPYFTNIAP
jgi:hypothetical protein